jgi:hypothetical protein
VHFFILFVLIVVDLAIYCGFFKFVLAKGIDSHHSQYHVRYEDSNIKIFRPSEIQGEVIVLWLFYFFIYYLIGYGPNYNSIFFQNIWISVI